MRVFMHLDEPRRYPHGLLPEFPPQALFSLPPGFPQREGDCCDGPDPGHPGRHGPPLHGAHVAIMGDGMECPTGPTAQRQAGHTGDSSWTGMPGASAVSLSTRTARPVGPQCDNSGPRLFDGMAGKQAPVRRRPSRRDCRRRANSPAGGNPIQRTAGASLSQPAGLGLTPVQGPPYAAKPARAAHIDPSGRVILRAALPARHRPPPIRPKGGSGAAWAAAVPAAPSLWSPPAG